MLRTQIFGAGASSGAVPPVEGGARTGEGPRGGVPNTTQTFGAVPPVRQGSSTYTAVPDTTQTFGAVPPVGQGASAQGAVPNTTQTFGAVPPVASDSGPHGAVPNTTQTFGAVPPVASGSGRHGVVPNTTQTFGAVPPVASGSGPQGAVPNTTQTFGAVPPVRSSAGSQGAVPNTTQTFGAVPPVRSGSGSQGAVPNTTQTFGAVPRVRTDSGPQGAVPNTTQTFGAVPPVRSDSGSQGVVPNTTQSFQVFGNTSQGSSVPPTIAPVTGSLKQPVGATEGLAPLGRTLTFGAVAEQSAPTGDASAFPGETQTRVYGAGSAGGTQSFGAVDSDASPVARKTSLYGAPQDSDGGVRLPPEELPGIGAFGAQGPSGSSASPSPRRPSVSLPPELLAAGRDRPESPGLEPSSSASRLWIGLLVGAGVLLAGVLAYPAWRDRDANMPAAAVADKDRAVASLRKDDAVSRDQAIASLRALTATHPKYTEAQAELVGALSLRLGELQAEADRLRMRNEHVQREISAYQKNQLPVDWPSRVNVLQEESDGLARVSAPLRTEVDKLRKELDVLAAALKAAPEVEPAPALAARVKALALHAGVTAAPDALALAERLRNVESAPKIWSTVARAEYVLSSGSPPDSVAQSANELERLRQADGTLLRAHVLGARLALRMKDPKMARSLLDEVRALNPNHELARKLLEQLDKGGFQP
ncbi:hypothetical protein [Myxococcus sp. AM011]|uniref:hypothetical protein n=1 Tax=Myxococcus sp. AM011 TaxID=2745200 RepID=UPI0020CD2D48|nr:hypothetical protein [Myxococcus sp. AM011]